MAKSSTRVHPAVWLVYLIFFVMGPLINGQSEELFRTAAILGIFVPLYFWTHRQNGYQALPALLLMTGLGYYGCLSNLGAATFYIYAAALGVRLGTPSRAFYWLGALLLLLSVITVFGHGHTFYMVPMVVSTAMIGLLCIHQENVEKKNDELRQSREEVTRLAKTAERERIARDLHDLLGHTLSLVVLKSQLAGRLLARAGEGKEGPTGSTSAERAAAEVAEVERIARQALQEVRTAVAGWRSAGLEQEIANARSACELSGLRFLGTVDAQQLAELPPLVEGAMAMALREAVTNLLRHAEATLCRIRLSRQAEHYQLEIEDDGRGLAKKSPDGQGMASIRQRVAQLGGTATWLSAEGGGTLLRLELPRQGESAYEALDRPAQPEAA